MFTYSTYYLIYAFIVLIISIIYYRLDHRETNNKRRLNKKLSNYNFDKYLIEKRYSSSDTDTEDIYNAVSSIIEIISKECSNFLISEVKLIFIYGFILSILFFFTGKEYNFYFCFSFLLGITVSLIAAYEVTLSSISKLEHILDKTQIDLNSAFKTSVEISSKLTVLVFSISLFTFIFYAFIINTFLESEILTFDSICGYGFGCSFSALFCRISGGIFTKGSDISCDIIGKLENEFEENDQKNPSSIADNIGDLVGDLTGSVLDLITIFNESISAISIIISHSNINKEYRYTLILFFLTLFITSILVFIIIELISARYREKDIIDTEEKFESYFFNLINLNTFFLASCTIIGFAFFDSIEVIFYEKPVSKHLLCSTILIGLISGVLICYSTYYYTGKSHKPIQNLTSITNSSSLNVIYGLYIGNFSTVVPMIIIAITVLISDMKYGIYGLSFSSFGMLLNLPIIISLQIYGPISDVTLGLANMLKFKGEMVNYINQLDITGNTMSAVVKGYACGSGGLVSFGLYGALMITQNISVININQIDTIILLILGALFTYVIQGVCMQSTASNAILLINESKKQLLRKKDNNSKPDYYECIQISAHESFVDASWITWLCILVIFSIGVTMNSKLLISFVTGIIISGIPITISSSNSGSAWDNSKKILEMRRNSEIKEEYMLNKTMLDNAIIADNVGDVMKDIAGPSVNMLIKFSAYFSLIIINFINI